MLVKALQLQLDHSEEHFSTNLIVLQWTLHKRTHVHTFAYSQDVFTIRLECTHFEESESVRWNDLILERWCQTLDQHRATVTVYVFTGHEGMQCWRAESASTHVCVCIHVCMHWSAIRISLWLSMLKSCIYLHLLFFYVENKLLPSDLLFYIWPMKITIPLLCAVWCSQSQNWIGKERF